MNKGNDKKIFVEKEKAEEKKDVEKENLVL